MPAKGKKSLPVDNAVHQSIKMEAARVEKEMYVVVGEAWDLYLKSKGFPPVSASPPQRKNLGR